MSDDQSRHTEGVRRAVFGASKYTVVIIAVVAIAAVAGGFAYAGGIINPGNTSSGEYGIVAMNASSVSDAIDADGTVLYYTNLNERGSFYMEFSIALTSDYVSELGDDEFIVISLEQKGEQIARYTNPYGGLSQRTAIIGDVLGFTGYGEDYDFKVSLSDGSLLDPAGVTGISVTAHYLTEVS